MNARAPKRRLFQTCFLFYPGCIGANLALSLALAANAANPTVRDLVRTSQKQVITAYADWFRTDSQNARWLRAFLKDVESDKTNRPPEDWCRAVRRMLSLAKLEHRYDGSSGFIEDKQMIPILVSALKESHPELRELALKTLIWEIRSTDVAPFEPAIKEAIGSKASTDDLLLLARLSLDDNERRGLLERPELRQEIRARLGDGQAERDLIQQFEAETDYGRKASRARRLSYAGTAACAKALVDSLRSPLSIQGPYGERSIRCNILLALGQIYQDEELFTRAARFLAENGDDTFNRHRDLAKYIKAVDAWVQTHFGQSAWANEPVWFIRWHYVPVPQTPLKP